MNLDILLDNDRLSADQERSVRLLLDYEIKREKNVLVLSYKRKRDKVKFRHHFNLNDKKENQSVTAYKHVMYYLITRIYQKSTDDVLLQEIKLIINEYTANFQWHGFIKTDSQVLFNVMKRVMVYE